MKNKKKHSHCFPPFTVQYILYTENEGFRIFLDTSYIFLHSLGAIMFKNKICQKF